MVLDPQGQLVCLTVYKRGTVEVVRRLADWAVQDKQRGDAAVGIPS